MKRILLIILALVFSTSLLACTSSNSIVSTSVSKTTSAASDTVPSSSASDDSAMIKLTYWMVELRDEVILFTDETESHLEAGDTQWFGQEADKFDTIREKMPVYSGSNSDISTLHDCYGLMAQGYALIADDYRSAIQHDNAGNIEERNRDLQRIEEVYEMIGNLQDAAHEARVRITE